MTFVDEMWSEERARLEHELRRARRLEKAGRLAAGVAHDCNNLLTAIQGYSELLLGADGLDEPARRDVEEIAGAAARAAALIRQLLTFAGGDEARAEPVDVNEVLRGVERLLAPSLGACFEIEVVLAAGPLVVEADPGQLEQVVLNLVLNARDAMPSGGTIVIESAAHAVDPRDLLAERLASGAYVRIAVVDGGVGMEPHVLARAFEPFFTTKERHQGSGLGLATAAAIVEQFGGAVVLDSEPGLGTAATIYLPARDTIERTRT